MAKNTLSTVVTLDPERTDTGTSSFDGIVDFDDTRLYGFTPYVNKADKAAADLPVQFDEESRDLAEARIDAEAARHAKVLRGEKVEKRERDQADEVSRLEDMMGAKELTRRPSPTQYIIDGAVNLADCVLTEWPNADFARRSELTRFFFGPGMLELMLTKAAIAVAADEVSDERLLDLATTVKDLELIKTKADRKIWAEALVKAATKVPAERISLVRTIANDTNVRVGVLNAPRTKDGGNDGMLDAVWKLVSVGTSKTTTTAAPATDEVSTGEVEVKAETKVKTQAKRGRGSKGRGRKAQTPKATPVVQAEVVEAQAPVEAPAAKTQPKRGKGYWAAKKAKQGKGRKPAPASATTPVEAHGTEENKVAVGRRYGSLIQASTRKTKRSPGKVSK